MLKELLASSFVRNSLVVAGGTAGAQAISLIFSPFVARIYGPDAFGVLGAFMATTAILGPMASLSYPVAIVLPAKNTDAEVLAALSFFISFFISLIVAAVLFTVGDSLAEFIGLEVLIPYKMLIPLMMFFHTVQQVMQQYLIRDSQFSVSAKVGLIHSFVFNASKVAGGCVSPVGGVLIVLSLCGSLLNSFLMIFYAKLTTVFRRKNTISRQSLSQLLLIAKAYSSFPLYRAPEVFLSAVSRSVPILVLASLAGTQYAGFYTMVKVVLKLPNTLLIKSIGDVFYPSLSKLQKLDKPLFPFVRKTTLSLFAIGFLPYLLFLVFGPELFTFVFGDEWFTAGVYAQVISVMQLFALSTGASVKAVIVIGEQKFFLLYRVSVLILTIVSLYSGFYIFKSDVAALSIYSGVNTFAFIYLNYFVMKKCKALDSKLV